MTNAFVPTGEPTERRKFQMTNLDGNNNKYYLVETWRVDDQQVFFRATYGRVGANPQIDEKLTSPTWVARKIREKCGKGYQEVALHRPVVAAAAPAPPSNIEPKVQQVVDYIYAEAGENIASYLSVGLDALSQDQIDHGRKLLMLAQAQHAAWRQSQSQSTFHLLAGTVQHFYNSIPTRLPSRIDRERVVGDFCANFAEQEDRLNQLEAAIATAAVQQSNPQVSGYDALGAQLALLPQNDTMYGQICDYIARTAVHGYQVRVHDIYTVRVPNERQAFEQNQVGRHHSALLFHGTAGQNVRHILRTGLICPKTASNGRMFGHGVYFANKCTKSTNYCSVRRKNMPHFLFLAEVALGTTYVAPQAMSDLRSAPKGHDSVHGKAGHTQAWGGTLQYDEFIVYSAAQQTLRYLVTFAK